MPRKPRAPTQLSAREELVHDLIVEQALTDREIAQRLGISMETVKQHTAHIYNRRCVRSRAQLIVLHWKRVASGKREA